MMLEMLKEIYQTMNAGMAGGTLSIETANAILNSLKELSGKDYCIIHLRVCYRENNKFYDAWVNA